MNSLRVKRYTAQRFLNSFHVHISGRVFSLERGFHQGLQGICEAERSTWEIMASMCIWAGICSRNVHEMLTPLHHHIS